MSTLRPHRTRAAASCRGARRPWSSAAVALAALLLAISSLGASSTAGAQERRVVVIGDSIILGAQAPMTGAFQGAGWAVTYDAAVSRSTLAAVEAIEAHRAELTDSVVLSFGANDGGNPGAFRQRVSAAMAATASVPNVYWLTIREVRDYYAGANQIIREVAAAHPNVTVIDWHAVTAGTSDLTAGDGLHLTGAGAARMTEVITGVVVNGVAPVVAPPAPPPTEPPPPPPTTAAPAPVTAAPTTAAPTTAPPTTAAPTTEAPTTTAEPEPRRAEDEIAADVERAVSTSTIDYGDAVGWTLGGFLLMVVLLALGGAGVGGWALIGTRGRGDPGTEVPVHSEHHPAVRARQRAERIAEARRELDDPVDGHGTMSESQS